MVSVPSEANVSREQSDADGRKITLPFLIFYRIHKSVIYICTIEHIVIDAIAFK